MEVCKIMGSADKILFDNDSRVAPLGLIPMEGAKELGEKVKELGCKKVMCVYDAGVKAAGAGAKAPLRLDSTRQPWLPSQGSWLAAGQTERSSSVPRRDAIHGVRGQHTENRGRQVCRPTAGRNPGIL